VPAPERRAAGGAADAAGSGRYEIRLSGAGGQGLILAATVLADALTASGKEVLQTQSYGPEARGGASRAEIIVSAAEIDYPEVTAPDVTLCLSQEAFDSYAAETKPGGVVVYDQELVASRPLEGVRLVGLPFSDLAERELDKVVVANTIALGALLKVTGLIGADYVRDSLRRLLPARFLELNLKALALGLAARERLNTSA
jgi:2-oxoglutarate ferredoxin oxidoreductase subunit gamma